MMNKTTRLFSLKTLTRNWYVQKWLLVFGFIALLGFNAKWIAKKALPKAGKAVAISNKPVVTPKNNKPTPVFAGNGIPAPTAAPKKVFMEICDNGIDDDGDGLIDCYDPDCENSTNCDGFFYGSPIPSCNFTASTGNFTITEVWNTKTANNSNNPLDQRATVMVGDMDGDGIPEIVAKRNDPGRLYLFNGQNGKIEVEVAVSASHEFTSVAIGDVDNDGLGEVFFFDSNGSLNRYDYANGTLTKTFTTDADGNAGLYTPNLADFNHDGIPEVYVGNKIYSSVDGSLLVDGGSDASTTQGAHDINDSRELFSIAIDVLPDDFCTECSGLEIVAGNVVYAVNVQTGAISAAVTAPAGLNDGVTSVADVDVDGDIDGIVVSNGKVYVWDLQTSTQLYNTYTLASTTKGGRANVANFDDDSQLEIGVAGKDIYVVLDPTGSPSGGTLQEKWTKTELVDNSERTSSTVFDFDGDGVSEVVYSEEEKMMVYNGITGGLKTTITSPSGTRYDNPVIADVNGDGQTEIIVTAQDKPGSINSGTDYIRCFKSTDLPWRPSRPVWNQHNYFIVNVNDDLTIPKVQQSSMTIPSAFDGKPYKVILNTFLNQASIYDVAGDHIFPAPDISAEINGGAINICQNGTDVSYSFLITNGGSADLPAGTNIAVFSDNPYQAGNNAPNLIQELSTPSVIPENGTLLMSGTISEVPKDMDSIYILLNHNHTAATNAGSYPLAANTVVTGTAECSYANNIATKTVTQSAPPSNTLTVTAGGNIVCPNGSTTITVQKAENGVTYQLRSGTNKIGATQVGNGTSNLTFNTGNLTADQTFNILATNGGCGAVLTTTQTVKVIDQSLNVKALVSSICSGESTEIRLLKSQDGITYQLRNGTTPIGATKNGNGGTISFSTGAITVNPTTFNILANGGACTAGVQMTNIAAVNVVDAPSASLTVGANTNVVCSGGTANITVENSETGVSYQLRKGTTKLGVAVAGTGGTLTFQTPAVKTSTTFNVLATRDGCTDVPLTQTQTITNTTISTGLTVGAAATTICTGSGTNITVASSQSGVSYQLRNNASNADVGTAVIGNGGTINLPTGNLTSTTTFNVFASLSGCTSEQLTATQQVTVADNPHLTLAVGAASTSICVGTSTNITIASSEVDVSYQLRNDAGDVAVGTPLNGNGGVLNLPTGNLNTATTFNVLATRTGCTAQELNNTVTVSMLDTPDAALTVEINSTTICSGESVTVTVKGAENNVSYQLLNGGTNVGDAQTGNGSGDLVFTASNLTSNATLSVQATNLTTSCQKTLTTTHNVTVNPLPDNSLDVTADKTNICSGDNVTITVKNAVSGFNYQLTDGTNNIESAKPGANADLTFDVTNLTASATYRVIATNTTTNCSATLTQVADITVNTFDAIIENGANVTICGTSGTLTAPSIAGASYQWQKDENNIGTDSNQLTVTAGGNYIVVITVGGCTKPSPASVVTLTTPPVSSVAITSDATNNTACAGQAINFTATPANGGTNPTYQWRINGGDVAGANQSTFTSTSLTSGDAVSVVMTADLTCATPVTSNDIVVTINALPTVTFTGVNATVDGNNQVTIDEGNSVTINLTGGASYTWTPNTGISSLSTDGSEAVLAPTSTITYVVTATSSEGCVSNGSDTLQVVVRPNTDIFIPSLFSPNGDGKNDRFVLRGQGFQRIDFRVYDRSGNLMYRTTSIDEATSTGWDGTSGGVDQPIGMYTWSIDGTFVDGRKITFNGFNAGKINLLR